MPRTPGFLVIALVGLLLAACQSGQPELSVEPLEFDFGDVTLGDLATQDVTIANTGSGELVIEGIATSCGCTTANIDENRIPAGQETILHITFDSAAHGDVTGFYTRQVYLSSNDPGQPEIRIEFTANVIREAGQ
ncbi:MAG: DUF1573 domain-containing protein [Anaerolineales bacterium]